MTTGSQNGAGDSTVEAYKAIIDFNKTIITISSSVLTALIAYIVYQHIELNSWNYGSIISIIGAILLSLYGFGNAIKTVKDGVSRKGTILVTNVSGYLLIIGICLILTFNHTKQKNVNQVLSHIENTTSSLKQKLIPSKVKTIEFNDENFIINYAMDSISNQVIYSTLYNKIISIK